MSHAHQRLAQEYRIGLGTILGKIILITLKDLVDDIATGTIRARLGIRSHSLGHPSHQHKASESLHQLLIECFQERVTGVAVLLGTPQSLLPRGQQKLVKRHGIDKQRTDPTYAKGGQILQSKLKQRTSRHNMQFAIILLEEPKAANHILTPLYLVQKEKSLTWNNRNIIIIMEFTHNIPHVTISLEDFHHLGISLQIHF